MSNKLDLSHLQRDGAVSLTQQLVDRFVDAIETSALEPGEKLPTTRALAAEAGINHLTAARVYRRLAELGYVTATVGRGTFVRSLVPAAADEQGDDWQTWALPELPAAYASQVMDDAFRLATDPDVISLSTGFPSPRLYPADEIIVTSGARQAIDLVARALVEPGDVVVIESPTFAGLLSSLRATGARVIGIPCDDQGFDVAALQQVLARHE